MGVDLSPPAYLFRLSAPLSTKHHLLYLHFQSVGREWNSQSLQLFFSLWVSLLLSSIDLKRHSCILPSLTSDCIIFSLFTRGNSFSIFIPLPSLCQQWTRLSFLLRFHSTNAPRMCDLQRSASATFFKFFHSRFFRK